MKDAFAEHSFSGNLLVASSLVTDPIYANGVCLVVHQDNEHVIGVMLNRPLKPSTDALMEMLGQKSDASGSRLPRDLDEEKAGGNEATPDALASSNLGLIHFGGPLSGPVVALHQDSQFAEAEPGIGIYLAAQKHHLEDLLRQQPTTCRLIVGHLGWHLQQLEAEIDAGLWHLSPATAETVFASPANMWSGLIRRATSRSMARWMGTPDVIGASELN